MCGGFNFKQQRPQACTTKSRIDMGYKQVPTKQRPNRAKFKNAPRVQNQAAMGPSLHNESKSRHGLGEPAIQSATNRMKSKSEPWVQLRVAMAPRLHNESRTGRGYGPRSTEKRQCRNIFRMGRGFNFKQQRPQACPTKARTGMGPESWHSEQPPSQVK